MHGLGVLGDFLLLKASKEKIISVNSFRQQAVALNATVPSSNDQIVEALQVSGDDFQVSVQWYPERIYQGYPEKLRLVECFIKATRKRS